MYTFNLTILRQLIIIHFIQQEAMSSSFALLFLAASIPLPVPCLALNFFILSLPLRAVEDLKKLKLKIPLQLKGLSFGMSYLKNWIAQLPSLHLKSTWTRCWKVCRTFPLYLATLHQTTIPYLTGAAAGVSCRDIIPGNYVFIF